MLYLKFTAPHWKEYQNCLSAAHNKIFALLIRRMGSRYWQRQVLCMCVCMSDYVCVFVCLTNTRLAAI